MKHTLKMTSISTAKPSLAHQVFSLLSRPQAAHVAILPVEGLHPLDPLTAGEITAAGLACRAHAEKLGVTDIRFNAITLQVHHACVSNCSILVQYMAMGQVRALSANSGAIDSMQEPPKAALLAYEASGRRSSKPSRRAFCICQLPSMPGSCVAEVVVELTSSSPSVLQWKKVHANSNVMLSVIDIDMLLHAWYKVCRPPRQGWKIP